MPDEELPLLKPMKFRPVHMFAELAKEQTVITQLSSFFRVRQDLIVKLFSSTVD